LAARFASSAPIRFIWKVSCNTANADENERSNAFPLVEALLFFLLERKV
jgi:hypothetical protein